MQTKKNKRVYLVIVNDCFDYENSVEISAFSNYKKAMKFYSDKLEEFKNNSVNYKDIVEEQEYFLAYDEGWYNRDHYEISIETKEIL